jgi:hypothetical protein
MSKLFQCPDGTVGVYLSLPTDKEDFRQVVTDRLMRLGCNVSFTDLHSHSGGHKTGPRAYGNCWIAGANVLQGAFYLRDLHLRQRGENPTPRQVWKSLGVTPPVDTTPDSRYLVLSIPEAAYDFWLRAREDLDKQHEVTTSDRVSYTEKRFLRPTRMIFRFRISGTRDNLDAFECDHNKLLNKINHSKLPETLDELEKQQL